MQVETANIRKDIANIQQDAKKRHEEVLKMIEALSDATDSDQASSVWKLRYLEYMRH
jgi:hypothetical protein